MYKKVVALDSQNSFAYHKLSRSFLGDFFRNDDPDTHLDSTILHEYRAGIIDPQYAQCLLEWGTRPSLRDAGKWILQVDR